MIAKVIWCLEIPILYRNLTVLDFCCVGIFLQIILKFSRKIEIMTKISHLSSERLFLMPRQGPLQTQMGHDFNEKRQICQSQTFAASGYFCNLSCFKSTIFSCPSRFSRSMLGFNDSTLK